MKDRALNAADPGTSVAALRDAVRLVPPQEGAESLGSVSRVLIVDDVFATGRTAAVLVEQLAPLVAPHAEFTVVGPLCSGYLAPPGR